MLDERGQFDFTGELLDLVEAVWRAYQESHGRPRSAQERLVGLAYIVAALRRDIDAIGAHIAEAPELQGLDVAGALQEVFGASADAQASAARAELERRGWLAR
jgi:hypothetical protein